MNVKLSRVAHARSGDKGANSNVGLIFKSETIYKWAKDYLTSDKIKSHCNKINKDIISIIYLNNSN